MQDSNETARAGQTGPTAPRAMSRREFLRMAGAAAGAATVFGAGLGGLLPGCDDPRQTSNTTATIRSGETTTTIGETTSTTIYSAPETGRDIWIGLVSAWTGPLALFGKAVDWWTDFALTSLPDGILCGDGRLHRFRFTKGDSRSEPDRAARVAASLISDAMVDVILCSGGTDIVNPVADQADTLLCPCLCNFVHWRPFVYGRGVGPDRPFQWACAHAIGLEDITANFIAMWDQVETNKKVGLLFPDNTGGREWEDPTTGLPPTAAAAGYQAVLPGLYPVSTVDYTTYITEFKKNGCEICCGTLSTVDFAAFWQQAADQGYRPKVVSVSEALLFPHALEAIGASAQGVTTECLWLPEWPYRDSITGKTCGELAKDYTSKMGDQWIAPIAEYATFEWAVDAFKKVTNFGSRMEFITQARLANLDTCLGPIDFTTPVDTADLDKSRRPAENVCKTPVGGMQWVAGDAFEFEPLLVTDANNAELAAANTVQPMDYGPGG